MSSLSERLEGLVRLEAAMQPDHEDWARARRLACSRNAWFTEENVDLAASAVRRQFLQQGALEAWAARYDIQDDCEKTLGLVTAGNIPLVGFHDFLCAFVSGVRVRIKLSSKDEVLLRYLIGKLVDINPAFAERIEIAEMLQGCDAYIATGSNNSSRYFEQYFGRFPHIIRKNRTSVAVLRGDESDEDLTRLSRDVFQYFGLGCRNVTQLCVPEGYDFTRLLEIFRNHESLIHHHKYKNNYDYHLALYLLNQVPYLTNESLLLVPNELPFSAVSVLHYRNYTDRAQLEQSLGEDESIQCIVGEGRVPFGTAQEPSLDDYADGVDTMAFLSGLC